jgi:hypothetical protein
MNADKIFQLLTISNRYKVKGTGADKSILYSSDYDLAEYWRGGVGGINYIEKVFKDKFRIALGNKDIFITDFKCGEIGGVPLRWNKKNIKTGVQIVKGKRITLCKALEMKSIIKMDIIAQIDGIFQEFSCNYRFNFGGITNYDTEDIRDNLLGDVKEYYKKGNSFKALRRLYSFVKISKREPSIVRGLQKYFNSPIGIMNKCKNQLEILILMLEQKFRPVPKIDLVENLEWIKNQLPPFGDRMKIIEIITILQTCKKSDMKDGLDFLRETLQKYIDEKTKMWIAENKNISYYIK